MPGVIATGGDEMLQMECVRLSREMAEWKSPDHIRLLPLRRDPRRQTHSDGQRERDEGRPAAKTGVAPTIE
jgi:hypothetical protein